MQKEVLLFSYDETIRPGLTRFFDCPYCHRQGVFTVKKGNYFAGMGNLNSFVATCEKCDFHQYLTTIYADKKSSGRPIFEHYYFIPV